MPRWLLLLALAALPPERESELPHLNEVVAALRALREHGPAGAALARRRLLELGPAAVPALFALDAGRVVPEPSAGPLLDESARELLLEVARDLPDERVGGALCDALEPSDSLAEHEAALRWLGEAGDTRSLLRFLRHFSERDPNALRLRRVQQAVERAVALVLARQRDPTPWNEALLPAADSPLWPALARALAANDAVDVDELLVGLLVRGEPLQSTLVACLGDAGPRRAALGLEPRCAALREVLDERPELARLAVASLARLRDRSALERIAELGQASHRGLRAAAVGALRELSGLDLGDEASAWLPWLRAQQAWSRERLPELARAVAEGDEAKAVSALRELVRHPLHGAAFAPALERALGHESDGVVVAAALALGELGLRASVPELVALLEDEREPVCAAALSALRRLTGLDLGADAEPWRVWLAG